MTRSTLERISTIATWKTALGELDIKFPLWNSILLRTILGSEYGFRQRMLRAACDGSNLLDYHALTALLTEQRFWVAFNEVFIAQEYRLPESFPKAPTILDCGANAGFAALYFKLRHPESCITSFEPVPSLASYLRESLSDAGISGVEVIEAAVSDRRGNETFLTSSTDPLAGSLTNRMRVHSHDLTPISVSTVRLSDYVTKTIDFLKLDIEGAELDVLRNLRGEPLEFVNRLFIEYHRGSEWNDSRLEEILAILREHDFAYTINPSLPARDKHTLFSMKRNSRVSLCIYASRVD